MKQRLILYLKAKGFKVEFIQNRIECSIQNPSHSNMVDIVTFKRGQMYNRHIVDVKEQLKDLGYDVSDYDKAIYRPRQRVQELTKMVLYAQWISDNTDSEGKVFENGELMEYTLKSLDYFNETVYPTYRQSGMINKIHKALKEKK